MILVIAPGMAFAASDIRCIEAKLGTNVVDRIGDRVVVALASNIDPSSALDLDRDAVIAARNACRAANRWSNDATDIAMAWLNARASRSGAERAITADGLSLQAIAAAYAGLPVAARRSLIGGRQLSPAVVASVRATGNPADTAKRLAARRHVMLLYTSLAALEFYPADFAAA